MSKITKKDLQYQINGLAAEASIRHNSIMRIHRALASIGVDIFSDDFDLTEPEPQLKQLDQSVFDGLDERWVAASVEENGIVRLYLSNENNPYDCEYHLAGTKYDTTDWQNSLIERDTAKELLEVDLSSELTGSELCKAMFARGATMIMCAVSNSHDQKCAITKQHKIDIIHDLESFVSSTHPYVGFQNSYRYATPINNQGEPLTASEVGL